MHVADYVVTFEFAFRKGCTSVGAGIAARKQSTISPPNKHIDFVDTEHLHRIFLQIYAFANQMIIIIIIKHKRKRKLKV